MRRTIGRLKRGYGTIFEMSVSNTNRATLVEADQLIAPKASIDLLENKVKRSPMIIGGTTNLVERGRVLLTDDRSNGLQNL